MADECILMIETELPIPMTCADGTGIEKGAVLELADTNTAKTTTGDTDPCAGICQSEKIASDGITSVSVYRGGYFLGVAGVAGVVFGEPVITDTSTSSANRLVKADTNSENIVGTCLQTASSGNTFLFHLKPEGESLA